MIQSLTTRGLFLLVAVGLVGCAVAAEPVAPVGQVKIASVDRTWKVVYGTSEGPEGRALELLTSEVGSAVRCRIAGGVAAGRGAPL